MEITPEKLEFHAPFTKHTSNNLELRNPTNEYFAFKVKTTAPKLFCVRPNASVVGPNESLTVSITHQALPQEPGPDYTSKDKFLILSAPLNEAAVQAGENVVNFVEKTKENIAEFWTEAEKTKSVPITSKKMKVQVRPFDANGQHSQLGAGAIAGGALGHSAASRGDQTLGDESFANYEAAAQSPAPHSPANLNNFQQQQQQQYQQKSFPASGVASHASEAVNRGTEAAVGVPAATSKVHSQDSSALGQAQDNISSLKKDISSEKHTVPSSQTSQAVGSQGVPVGVVAIVALLALLVGWFFL
ncbi:Vesicle-associated membrane protein-associated protein [Yarrowia sp. C11]|nr:Vesicle-associated membrane protein-associated protein [Yarrowia sp. E02]KAG5369495.1 Vesicle-associated membrane protein-associated protein [Yarrowia sp. C11]